MHHALWLAAFPLAVPLPTHHGIAPAPTEACALESNAASELEDLLPAESFVVVRAQSLNALLDPLASFSGSVDQDAAALWRQLSAALPDGFASAADHLDATRPVGLAFWLDAARSPQMTVALPTVDPAALELALSSLPATLHLRSTPTYVAIDSHEPAALGSSALSATPANRDLAVSVDLAALRTTFGPLIDLALDQAEHELDSRAANDGAASVALEQFDTWRTLLRTAERFEGYLDLDGEQLEARGRLALADARWTQAQFGLERRQVLDLGRCVDPTAALSVAHCGQSSAHAKQGLALLSDVEGALDDCWAPIVALAREHFGALAEQEGDASVLNVSLGLEGVFASLYLRSTSPEALCAKLESTLSSSSWKDLGVSFSGPHESLSAESTWREYAARLDVQALARRLAPEEANDPGHIAQVQSAVDDFVGPQGLRIALTAVDGFAVVRVGGSPAQALECVARLRRPQPSLSNSLADAFARSNESCAATIAHLDVGALLAQAELFAAGLGRSLDLPTGLGDERLPITFFAAASPSEFNGGLTLDARQLARLIQALRERR